MLRRRYAHYAYLKPLGLHGNLTIDVTRPAANPGADPKGNKSSGGRAQSNVAGPAEAFLPARNHLEVVDVVRDAALERGDHRARGPGHALPQLASLGVRSRVRREQDALAELAQG